MYPLQFVAFLLAGALLRVLGVDRGSALCGALWRSVAPLGPAHRRARRNLARAFPDKTVAERQRILLAMWDNQGRSFAEGFFVAALVPGQDRIAIEGADALEAWRGSAGAKLACAGQLAAWDMAIPGLGQDSGDPWRFYRRVRNPLIERRIAARHGFSYAGGLMQTAPNLPRHLLFGLRGGATVGVVVDPGEHDCDAFHRARKPAPSVTFCAELARATAAAVLMVRVRRVGGRVRFVQSFERIDAPLTADRCADVAALAAAIQERIERQVRDAPEQWLWTRPAG